MGYLGQLYSFTGPRMQVAGPQDYRSTGLQVQGKISYCIAAEYYKGTPTNRFFLRDVWGGMGFYLVTFLWLLKKYRFLQLTICCWLELDMSSPPILVDRSCVPDLRRSKPYSNLTLGLCAHPIRKNVDFRFLGILGNHVSRSQRNVHKTFLGKKSICESFLSKINLDQTSLLDLDK